MKIINIIALSILIMACQSKPQNITENTRLKNVPETFFQENYSSKFSIDHQSVTYNNHFKRLPSTEFSKFYLKKHVNTYSPYFNLTLNLSANGKITLDGTPNDKAHLITDILEFIDFAAQGKPSMLHLNFDENVSVKSFYQFITFIKPIEKETLKINENLFIYDRKQLPDCDCSL